MNRLQLALLLSGSLGVAAVACGGISDPTIASERVATVSGALTGSAVPANARVALIYRKAAPSGPGDAASVEVASDAPVVGGKFSMNLGVPAAHYFSSVDGHSFAGGTDPSPPQVTPLPEPDPAPTPPPPPPAPGGSTSSGGAGSAANVGTRDLVGGGIVAPLTAAVAGFVVYADSNGNGKLDLEGPYASSPDQILGGNKELILVYFKDGGALDYEKLRDKSGILPAAGFNLAWTEGRWLPLNVVELKLSADAKLPSPVCSISGISGSGGSGGIGSDPDTTGPGKPNVPGEEPVEIDAGAPGSSSSGGGGSSGSTIGSYPHPSDPNLKCSPDGRSFSYSIPSPPDCPPYTPPPPPPVGLCAGSNWGYDLPAPLMPRDCGGTGGYGTSLAPGQPVPPGWPCPVTTAVDAGPAGSSSGAIDAGSGGS